MYNAARDFRDVINRLIELLNLKASGEFIVKYSNDLTTFDNIHTNVRTSQIENIHLSRIEKLIQFPTSLDEYMKTINPDKTAHRKKLLEMYIVQITTKNYPIFLTDRTETAKIGFLTGGNYLPGRFGSTLPSLRFGPNNASKKDLTSANTSTHIGNVGEQTYTSYNKADAAQPIIADYLDDHFNIIKYVIVRYLIQKIYALIVSKSSVPKDKKFADILETIKKQIEETMGSIPEDIGMLLVMIAKSIDDIIMTNMKDMITSAANLISYNDAGIRSNLTRNYDMFIESLSLKQRPLAASPRELQIDLNAMNSELIKLYKTWLPLPQSYEDAVFVEPLKKDVFVVKGFDIFTRSNDSCYRFDSNVMKKLITSGANINAKNRDGNSPIYDAIAIGNENAVNILLENGAVVYNPRSNNRFGLNAFKHSLNSLKFVIKSVVHGDFIGDTTDLVNDEIMKKTQYKSIMRYNEIILRMTMYLMNHQLYLLASGYPKDWTYDKNKRLNSLIGDLSHPLPLLSLTFDNVGIGTLDILNAEIQRKQEDIIDRKTTIAQYDRSINNLKLEEADIGSKSGRSDVDDFRLKQIRDKINDLSTKKKSLRIPKGERKTLDKTEKKLGEDISAATSNFKSNLKRFKYTNDVIDIYDSVFTKIINKKITTYPYATELRTYPNVWKSFLKTDSIQNDRTQGIITMMKKVDEMIDGADPDVISTEFALFSDFSENVLDKFINDYFDLPNEYNKTTNYALEKVLNIIMHVTKHTMCVNLYHVILKLIKNHVIQLNPMGQLYRSQKDYNDFIEETVKSVVITSGTGKSNSERDTKFIEYIMKIISEKAIKSSLGIYEHDSDPDKDIDLLAYLNEINKRLMSNTTVSLSDSSSVIKSLNDYVFPYFKDYMEIYIKHMKQMIDNYLKCLYTYNKYLKIVKSVADKAVKEKKLL
jgi:hypothetical protein